MPAVDELLGGLIAGDNVVWVGSERAAWLALESAFLGEAAGKRPTLVVACSAAEARRAVPTHVEVINASAASRYARPNPLADAIEAFLVAHPASTVSVRGFAELVQRWGEADATAFFARTCPTMLQAGAVTYWWMPPTVGRTLLDKVRQVTQLMLELRSDQLHVTKAESRPAGVVGTVHDARLDAEGLHLRWNPSAGRLARGLAGVRRDLGLSQAQLAAIAGITPSAISQAESGARGLSLDTLITIADRLEVSLDRLVMSRPVPGYWLARHDRSRVSHGHGVTALAGDASVGLRALFVVLDGNEEGTPPADHHGSELVAVVRGLVQIETGDDAPVLRAGDSLLTATSPVRRWRNLRPDSAAFYWILRD